LHFRLLPPVPLRSIALAASLALAAVPALAAPSLQPTHAALLRQSLGAREAGFRYLANDEQVHDAVRDGELVALRSGEDYYIHPDVRHSAARPEVKAFVERLAQQYHAACGERLVVTSLVRPRNRQPWNSDPLSVHPTGMAVDLRISNRSSCRSWLERTLLQLESQGLVEAARERVVPHYHIVVFPSYTRYLESNGVTLPAAGGVMLASLGTTTLFTNALPVAAEPGVVPAALPVAAEPGVAPAAAVRAVTRTVRSTTSHAGARPTTTARRSTARHTTARKQVAPRRYKVRRGDTLWSIARKHGVTVEALRRSNRVSAHLAPGKVLSIPAR
jgi:LysM repeat protein